MEKFSKLKTEEQIQKAEDKKILYKDDNIKVIRYQKWSIISKNDAVFCIPYLIEQNKFVIRQEYVPSYELADGQQLHISLVGGGIEKGETPEEALLRELQEEAGIVVRAGYKVQLDKPLFMFKGSTNKYYTAILPLTESDYHEIPVDKKQEHKLDSAAKVDIKYVNSLNVSDVITELMIEKFKKYLNL